MNPKQEALVEKFSAKLDQAKARLDLLAAKAREADASSKMRLQEDIDDLRDRKTALQNRLDQLKQASGDAWDDLAEGAEASWKALGKAVDRAASRYGH